MVTLRAFVTNLQYLWCTFSDSTSLAYNINVATLERKFQTESTSSMGVLIHTFISQHRVEYVNRFTQNPLWCTCIYLHYTI